MLRDHVHNHELLFLQVAEGDENAFRELFNIYIQRLSAFVFKLTKSDSTTTELVQDIFVKLWVNRGKLRDVENHQAYLFSIASNCTMDHLRKVAANARMKTRLWQQMAVSENNTEDSLTAKESEQLINAAVVQLSAQKQKIFTLSRNEGLNHEQIAHHLQLSKSTVKNHIVETLRHIRSYLHRHSETLVLLGTTAALFI